MSEMQMIGNNCWIIQQDTPSSERSEDKQTSGLIGFDWGFRRVAVIVPGGMA